MSEAGSGKGFPKEPRKEATSPPYPEPYANWVQGVALSSERRYGNPSPGTSTGAGATFSTPPKSVLAGPRWVRLQPGAQGRREAGIVLASMGLCLPSQALGTMPAESKETPTHPPRNGWEGKGGTTSKLLLPQKAVQVQSPV